MRLHHTAPWSGWSSSAVYEPLDKITNTRACLDTSTEVLPRQPQDACISARGQRLRAPPGLTSAAVRRGICLRACLSACQGKCVRRAHGLPTCLHACLGSPSAPVDRGNRPIPMRIQALWNVVTAIATPRDSTTSARMEASVYRQHSRWTSAADYFWRPVPAAPLPLALTRPMSVRRPSSRSYRRAPAG